MKHRSLLALAAGLWLSASTPASTSAQSNREDASDIVLDFQSAPLDEAIADLARSMKTTFIFDERLTGEITLISDHAVSRSETIPLLQTRLKAQGFDVRPVPVESFVIHSVNPQIDSRSPKEWVCAHAEVKKGAIFLDLRRADISSVLQVMKGLTPRDIHFREEELPAGLLTVVSDWKLDLREGCLVLEAALSLKDLVLVEEAQSLRVVNSFQLR
jgi:type II secretory pathway component GspD/PulD (secretin)